MIAQVERFRSLHDSPRRSCGRAVHVLLAPMGKPTEVLDLPGLSDELSKLTVVEFDAWLAGLHGGAHSWTSSEDQSERAQLAAMREVAVQRLERDRLRTVLKVERSSALSADDIEALKRWDTTEERLAQTDRSIAKLTAFLSSAGWKLAPDLPAPEDASGEYATGLPARRRKGPWCCVSLSMESAAPGLRRERPRLPAVPVRGRARSAGRHRARGCRSPRARRDQP